jgi:sugar O-acyltransferase (sialic acid O-acetyltransferase NeuD family)
LYDLNPETGESHNADGVAMPCVLYGIGSPLVVDYEESCARHGVEVAAAVKNVAGRVHTISAVHVYDADELPAQLLSLPVIVPIFTPGHRRLAVEDARRRGFDRHFLLIDQTAIVARSTTVGEGTFVNCGAVIGGGGQIGNFVVINRSASLGHHARIGDYASIGPAAVLAGNVALGRGAVVGVGAVIVPEITVGDNAVVGAGSVVTRNVPANSLVAGSPARVLRSAIVGYNDLAA